MTSTSLRPGASASSSRRSRSSDPDQRAEAFDTDVLCIVEIDADERIAAVVTFDPDDFDAAFAELDARYLAGEAAAYARTWSVDRGGYAALNRHELPRRRRTGSTSTTGAGSRSRPAT